MNNFKDYVNEQEKNKNDILNEDTNAALAAAAVILGIPTVGLLSVYGSSLFIYSVAKGVSKIDDLWNKIRQTLQEIRGKRVASKMNLLELRKDPLVKQELNKAIENKREYYDVLKEVYEAIDKKDIITTKEKYEALTPAFRNMPAVKQIIINELTKTLGEPPLWPPSPGNKTYKAIRTVLGLQEAKAAAKAVLYSASKATAEEV